VDDYDSYDDLCNFVEIVSSAMNPTAVDGRPLFAIHARKAILGGLSPAENRTVPPLRYEWAYALARDFPEVGFVVNGGIDTLREAADIADGVGVPEGGGRLVGTMIGRAVHADPWGVLSDADVRVFGSESNPRTSRRDLLVEYVKYCDATHGRFGTTKDGYSVPSIRHLMHPLQNLFLGEPNAKVWRRKVDEALKHDARNPDVTVGMILERTLGVLSDETLDAPPGDRSTSARHGLKKSGVTLGELPPMPTRTVLVPTGR
jgi:tRNA-dihydrouridine synthase A